jgi:stage II sporulation protein P
MKRLYGLMLFLILLVIPAVNTLAQDELKGGYMTLQSPDGKVITWIGHRVVVGDEYLAANNRLYRVEKVRRNTAVVRMIKKNGLATTPWANVKAFISEINPLDFLRAEVKQRGPIGIYHTHSDESYVPTDGTSSKPAKGGIFQVGDTLAKALEAKGIPVIHSKDPHDPHDGMAYDRSRRTAAQLLRNRPICLIDVHRDAGPTQGYSQYVNQKAVTKVQLVVGRQNPNFQANNDFAKQIKAVVDRKNPGFIKGIFYGKGKFNQDLGPRTILLEFGTEQNSKEAAERGAQIFAAAASEVIYGPTGTGRVNRGSFRSLFWIIVALGGGIGLFLLLNRSSLKNVAKEFTGAVGEGEAKPVDDSKSTENSAGQNPSDPQQGGGT